MFQNYRVTFIITLGLVFLAPLFFVPGGALPLGVAKSSLLLFGTMLLALSYLYESFRQGTLSFPNHRLLVVAALLPAVYLLSALLSTPSSLSLLGYNLEIGTFGYALMGAIALIITSSITIETGRYFQVLAVFFASLLLLSIFSAIKILFGGDLLVFGNFFGNMANPLGSWTDLSVASGLLASLSALAIGMVPMKPVAKAIVYLIFILSVFLLVVIGFSTGFMLSLISAVFIFWYFLKIEKDFYFQVKGEKVVEFVKGSEEKVNVQGNFLTRPTFLPIVLAIVSLVMFINPSISETSGSLSSIFSQNFGVQNTDIRPTLSATLGISKAVLSGSSLLGSGPNTFGQDWLIFKPLTINATPFWGVAFPFGVGFIPTQIATTGILGSALWVIFLTFLLILSFKVLNRMPESRTSRFTLITTLFISLLLWLSALFYVPSSTLLFMAFLFTGFLVALAREAGIVGYHSHDLTATSPTRSFSLVMILALACGSLYFAFLGGEKALAAYHFQKAVKLSNLENIVLTDIENELLLAVGYDKVDIYYSAISRLNFSKAQSAANASTDTAEANQALFEDGLRKSIEAARMAVGVNPASYANWVALGSIYSALVGEPLKLEGAYENAQSAYNQAFRRNPNNPELPLFLARLELAKGNADQARSYIRNSMALKEDYADAYLLLAQLEMEEKNIPAAIASTEALAILAPNNAGVHFELGVLKNSSKDLEGASKSLMRAIELAPEHANAKYYLALTYIELGKVGEAKKLLEELLVTNPTSKEVKALLLDLSKPSKEK